MMATSIKAISDEPGGSLGWRIPGSSGAPLVVFFHGLGGHRLSWNPQLSALGGLQRCLDCDLPEYGRSPGLPSALPELASTGADRIADLGGGLIDVVGLDDAFRTKVPDAGLQRFFVLG
jgi:pimeloyl-ACP methyl ester carboxylesterase